LDDAFLISFFSDLCHALYMKAISIQQPWATLIAYGEKRIEWRSWSTSYRGELLICASARDFPLDDGVVAPGGFALAVVTLADVRPFSRRDLTAACMDKMPTPTGFAWVLHGVREIEPFPVKGRQRLFEVEPPFLRALPGACDNFSHIEFIAQLRASPE